MSKAGVVSLDEDGSTLKMNHFWKPDFLAFKPEIEKIASQGKET